MNNYEFTLTFSLPKGENAAEDYLDALYEAGCDDALIGTGHAGSIALEFAREAESATVAINSAIENVKGAITGAELIEAQPDLVGLTDMAEILKCSRQNVRKYMVKYQDFPKPVHTGKAALWHLWDVAKFKKNDFPETIAEVSKTTFRVNLEIQQLRYQRMIEDDMHEQKIASFPR